MDPYSIYQKVVHELKVKASSESCDGDYVEKILNHHKFNHELCHGRPFLELIMKTYKLIAPVSRQTDEYLELVPYLAAILDMLVAGLIIVDDIIDKSEVRSGKPCWYKIVGVAAAANDSQIMIASTFYILKQYFSHLDCYTNITEILSESLFVIGLGQHFDNEMSLMNYDSFTEENYNKMLRNKSSYSFYFSIGALMYLAGYMKRETHAKAKEFIFEIGHLGQVQNDFRDCYEDTDSLSKSTTDIEEGKCTWLAVEFLKIATATQKEAFLSNYGKRDSRCIAIIKELYNEVNLKKIYSTLLSDRCAELKEKALKESDDVPPILYIKLIDGLFKKDLDSFNNEASKGSVN